jgi:hypothetical protein
MASDMEFAYRPEAWHEMFAVIAVVAATLAGLLFVGLSMNVRTIVGSPVHLARAREALVTPVVLILNLCLIPDQDEWRSNRALVPALVWGEPAMEHSTRRLRRCGVPGMRLFVERRHACDRDRGINSSRDTRRPCVAGTEHSDLPPVVHVQCLESGDPCQRSLPVVREQRKSGGRCELLTPFQGIRSFRTRR